MANLRASQVSAAPATATGDISRPWLAIAVVLAGAFMASLDGFIVFVAAPAIQTDLHSSGADIQLIVAGYGLTYAVGMITGARLGDLYGRRRIFMLGMTVFTVASVACGVSPDVGSLIGSRLVQGLGSAMMFPQILSVIQVVLPAERRHGAFGALGAVIGISTVIGQMVGGLLIAANLFGTSWRPVFLVNVPIGVIVVALARWLVPESRAPRARKLDLLGVAVVSIALFLLVVPLVQGQQSGWPTWVWLSFAGSAAAFVGFAMIERRIEKRRGSPLVSPRLFGERAFVIGIMLVVTAFAGVYSLFLILSLTFQQGLGLSALGAALVYTPLALAFFITSLLAGRLAPRFGQRLLEAGCAISGIGFIVTIIVAATSGGRLNYAELLPSLIVIGAGNGLWLTQLFNAVLARIGPNEVGMASGVMSAGQQVGGALGVAVIGAVYYSALSGAGRSHLGSYAHALTAALVSNLVITVLCLGLMLALRRNSARVTA
jgi:EmrB/QacA subfamily drug resistance transporter